MFKTQKELVKAREELKAARRELNDANIKLERLRDAAEGLIHEARQVEIIERWFSAPIVVVRIKRIERFYELREAWNMSKE